MSPVFQTLAARAKAHHESVTAAYEAFYFPGTSPEASMKPRSSSQSSTERSASITKAWNAVKKAAKEHHDGVNAAYAVYHSAGPTVTDSRYGSVSDSPRSSVSSASSAEGKSETGAWQKLKTAAKKHHESVNATFGTYQAGGI